MFNAIIALFFRIISNPAANAAQKLLSEKHSAILINLYSFGLLSIFCLYPAGTNSWSTYAPVYWCCVLLAGSLCTLGSVCLIKALQYGEMSMLGPINSYKCVIGLVFGFVLLGEIPSIKGLLGTLLIITGSWFIFDTVKEGFSFKLLLRKDIFLRFCALFFTGCEAVILKKIILMSSPEESLILWCFSGFLFSLILMPLFKIKFKWLSKKDMLWILVISISLGIMQYSTNIVFEKLNVGLSLALFQLSSIISVIFGYFMFKEKQISKKIVGTVIMIIGSCLILL